MAIQVLGDQKLWLDGFDLSGAISALAVADSVELQDATVLGDKARRRVAGLRAVTAQHEGLWDKDTFDKVLFDRIGVANSVMSFAPQDALEGSVGYTFRAVEGEYTPKGAVGEVFAFSVSAEGDDGSGLIRGTLMHNAARTTSASGTARQLGAVSATQKLYAALHVIAASGSTPTLDVLVQSDDAMGFGTPTTQITFAQKAAIGVEWATPVAGAILDDWWRIDWTIAGGSPSFEFVVIVGIQ